MTIKLRKFNVFDYFRFLSLTLNSQTRKELDNSFFGYIIKGIKGLFSKKKDYKFAIIDNKKVVGSIALYKNDEKDYEIGFFILPKFRKKRIATKAAKKILTFGFKKLELERITAITDKKNKASQKVLKKLGFKIIKENKKEKEFIWEKSK